MTKPFSSSLSVSGFLSLRQVGLRPLGQVQGSSIYRIGWQRAPRISISSRMDPQLLDGGYVLAGGTQSRYVPRGAETVAQFANEGMWIELEKQTEAYNDARQLALQRLRDSAAQLGATAVVDVRLVRREFRPVIRAIEFTAIGTAIAGPERGEIGLTTLSGEEVRKLLATGYRPLDLVGGVSVVYVIAGQRTRRVRARLRRRSLYNQEYSDYTGALRSAQAHAIGRMRSAAVHAGAEGVIQTDVTHFRREMGKLRGDRDKDLAIHVEALGTAVTSAGVEPLAQAKKAVDLRTS